MNHPSVFPAKAGIHAPPPLSAPHVPAATQPIPKITQIKRITVQDKAAPIPPVTPAQGRVCERRPGRWGLEAS